jgi:hypothetical protein
MSENFRGGSLVDWRLALEPVDPLLASKLHEEADPYKNAEGLGLPIPPYAAFGSVTDFMQDTRPHIDRLTSQGAELFYVGLRPKLPNLPKYRELGLLPDHVQGYIQTTVSAENYDNYYLRLAEHATAEYGGTMVINPSGKIRLEMVKGEMANLATGAQTPEFTIESDQFTGVLRYSFARPALRAAVWQTINTIPTIDNGSYFRPCRTPGYYEFSLIRRKPGLKPVFFDYKKNSAFTVPEYDLG